MQNEKLLVVSLRLEQIKLSNSAFFSFSVLIQWCITSCSCSSSSSVVVYSVMQKNRELLEPAEKSNDENWITMVTTALSHVSYPSVQSTAHQYDEILDEKNGSNKSTLELYICRRTANSTAFSCYELAVPAALSIDVLFVSLFVVYLFVFPLFSCMCVFLMQSELQSATCYAEHTHALNKKQNLIPED